MIRSVALVSMLLLSMLLSAGWQRGDTTPIPPISYNGNFTAAHYEGQQVQDTSGSVLTVRQVSPSIMAVEGWEDVCELNANPETLAHFQTMTYPPGTAGFVGNFCSSSNRSARYSTPATPSDPATTSVRELQTDLSDPGTLTGTPYAEGYEQVTDEHWAAIGAPVVYPGIPVYGLVYWTYLHDDLGASHNSTHISFGGATYSDGTWLQQGIGQGFNVGNPVQNPIPQFFYQFKPPGSADYQPIRSFASPLPEIGAWNGVEIDPERCCFPTYNSYTMWRIWVYTNASGWVNPGGMRYVTNLNVYMARNVQVTVEEIDPRETGFREYFPYVQIDGVQLNTGQGYYNVDQIDPQYQSDVTGYMLSNHDAVCPPLGVENGGPYGWFEAYGATCELDPFYVL